jgi:signal transduction histidine kinase
MEAPAATTHLQGSDSDTVLVAARPHGSGRLRWSRQHWPSLLALALAAPLFAVTAFGTLYFPGRPFPGFLVMGNGVVPTVGLSGWTGMEAGVPFHARVLTADGRPMEGSLDLFAYVGTLPVGTPVQYTLEKHGRMVTDTVPTMNFGARDYWLTVGLYVVFGFVSMATGIGVHLMQPSRPAALAFMIQGVVTGAFALTGAALYQPHQWWLSRLHFALNCAFPASFVHLGLVFPVARRFVARQPAWLIAPYAMGLCLAAWVFATFYASPPRTTALYAMYLYTAASIAALIGLVAFGYWENASRTVRQQLRLVIPGLVVGTMVAMIGFVNISRSGGDFPMNFIAIPPVFFYLSVAYAIAKYDLFDVDTFVKQAVTYATLTILITVAYAGSLVLLGLALPAEMLRASPAFNIAFIVLIAFLFQPLRARVQHYIDRIFYRSRLDYRRTVGELSSALTSLLDLEEILSRVGQTVTEGLHLKSFTVVLWPNSGTQLWRHDPDVQRMRLCPAVPLAGLRGQLVTGEHLVGNASTQARDAERGADTASGAVHDSSVETVPSGLTALGAELVVPLTVRSRLIGCLALGPTRSGKGLSREDVDLLRTLAAQTAIALQNADSYRALQSLNEELETRIRARTAELEVSNRELADAYRELQLAQAKLVQTEKMASLGQLAAGVAHEINNPVSFIIGNVGPLRRHLDSLRSLAGEHGDRELIATVERIGEVLEVMTRGAERTAGIVTDLRTFSRVGEGTRQSVDLEEGIEVSLRLLRPRWAGRIKIHKAYGKLPRINAVGGQTNQVFMNLLANACDAIPDVGNIWIETKCENAYVTVTIRDDGVGIPVEHTRRIFDPFFTTKPLGKGTGLGLSISQGIVTDHGGAIEVDSSPGVGAKFTVTLPVQPHTR